MRGVDLIGAKPAYRRKDVYPYKSPSARDIPNAQKPATRLLGRWFGPEGAAAPRQLLGFGQFGRVYRMKVTGGMRDAFAQALAHAIMWRFPKAPVAVKIVVGTNAFAPTPSNDDAAAIVRRAASEIRREIDVHRALATSPAVTVRGKVYDVKRVVPRLYAAGYDEEEHAGVFVMQSFGESWQSLHSLVSKLHAIHKHALPRVLTGSFMWLRDRLEYALASMYAAGYVHMDFHAKNIMVNEKTRKIKIMDFGLSAKMPRDLRDDFRRRLENGVSTKLLVNFWDSKLVKFADSVVVGRYDTYQKRTATMYHHNVDIVKFLALQYTPNAVRNAPNAQAESSPGSMLSYDSTPGLSYESGEIINESRPSKRPRR